MIADDYLEAAQDFGPLGAVAPDHASEEPADERTREQIRRHAFTPAPVVHDDVFTEAV